MAETKNKKPISDRNIPSSSAKFSEEEKRMLIEGTDKSGRELSPAEKMKLSKMHTERTIGSDWRERGAERLAATESARAQQALDERSEANRKIAADKAPIQTTYTPKKAGEWESLPGGGRIKVGEETLANIKKFDEARAKEEKDKDDIKIKKSIEYSKQQRDALKKRYEDELMSRGFTPPKTREEENIYNKIRGEEFALARQAREDAYAEAEDSRKRFANIKRAERESRRNKDYGSAEYFRTKAEELNILSGGNIKDAGSTRRFFSDKFNKELMDELKARADERRSVMKKQTTANPEASSFSLTPRNAFEQKFGITPPEYAGDFTSSNVINGVSVKEFLDKQSAGGNQFSAPINKQTSSSNQQTVPFSEVQSLIERKLKGRQKEGGLGGLNFYSPNQ